MDSIGQPAPTSIPEIDRIEPRHKSVGGWLLFLCISLTVLNPLITIIVLVTSYTQSVQFFDEYPGMLSITIIDGLLSVGLMAFSIYAGVGLWRIQPGAVKIAKRYLLTFLAYQAVAAILPFTAGLPSSAHGEMFVQVVKDAGRSLFYFFVWYSYLNKSERVEKTFMSE